jgi:hypothetical protein
VALDSSPAGQSGLYIQPIGRSGPRLQPSWVQVSLVSSTAEWIYVDEPWLHFSWAKTDLLSGPAGYRPLPTCRWKPERWRPRMAANRSAERVHSCQDLLHTYIHGNTLICRRRITTYCRVYLACAGLNSSPFQGEGGGRYL